MPTNIHPTAIIETGAELDDGVTVEAYAYVGGSVKLGSGTLIRHHATVEGNTEMGRDNVVYPYALIGSKTQDLKFKGGNPGTRIGDGNTFREFCTVHAATFDGDFTVIGSNNNFLAYVHIAHDCRVGDHIVMSNNGTLAGHVTLGDRVVMGGLAAIHQFCRVGDFAMIGGMSKVVQDVPPYMIADGNAAEVRVFNKVGIERGGFSAEQIALVRTLYKTLYRTGLNHRQALEKLRELPQAEDPVAAKLIEFVGSSERGIC